MQGYLPRWGEITTAMNERFYRDLHSKALDSFTVSIDETDLWIGVKPYHVGMEKFCHDLVKKLRMNIKTYISEKPEFLTSLVPVEFDEGAPEIVKEMITDGKRAMVGPMAPYRQRSRYDGALDAAILTGISTASALARTVQPQLQPAPRSAPMRPQYLWQSWLRDEVPATRDRPTFRRRY